MAHGTCFYHELIGRDRPLQRRPPCPCKQSQMFMLSTLHACLKFLFCPSLPVSILSRNTPCVAQILCLFFVCVSMISVIVCVSVICVTHSKMCLDTHSARSLTGRPGLIKQTCEFDLVHPNMDTQNTNCKLMFGTWFRTAKYTDSNCSTNP